MIPKQPCKMCGVMFTPRSNIVKRVYCGVICQAKGRSSVKRRDCGYCGINFKPVGSHINHCSISCANKSRRIRFKLTCACGVVFLPKSGYSKCCSHACAGLSRRKPARLHDNGYLYVWHKGTRFRHKGAVAVHRLVMDEIVGWDLKRVESVHHINGNKLDNSINNLMVLSKSAHQTLHKREG
jgi:hypothetical protein